MKILKLRKRFFFAVLIIIVLVLTVVINQTLISITEAKIDDGNGTAERDNSADNESEDKSENFAINNDSCYMLDLDVIIQYPELPTGCEITALATVLNFYGCDTDKTYLAENYLETAEIGTAKPNEAFIGSPFYESAYGCYADVIVNSANGYIADNGLSLTVNNITGAEFDNLFCYVRSGTPVIFWATMNLEEPYESTVWNIDGEDVVWLANEHCMVLIGYDIDTDCCIACDPQKGISKYSRELLKLRYNQMGKQAIVIE